MYVHCMLLLTCLLVSVECEEGFYGVDCAERLVEEECVSGEDCVLCFPQVS